MNGKLTQMNPLPYSNSIAARAGIALVLALCTLAVCLRGLLAPELEGLDGAHHLMDGIFFHDVFTDMPLSNPAGYTFEYYKQYPALGFIFWPPLFPFVEGIIFKIAGISLLTAQVSIVLFGFLLAVCTLRLCLRYLPFYPALGATALTLITPGLYQYFNVVMLEIPTLAMMALTADLYLSIVHHEKRSQSFWYWQLLALVAAASLYTKQTAFILLPAIVIDLLVNHRRLMRCKSLWFGLLAAIILVTPLALFTLKFGKANIEQSVGQNTQLIMSGYQGMARWSLENWLYYGGVFMTTLTLPVLVLAVAEIICSLVNRARLQQNTLLLAWAISFYVIFSYFDNKSDRFSTLAVAPMVLLAALFLWRGLPGLALPVASIRCALIAVLVCYSAWICQQQTIATMSGTHAILQHLDVSAMNGNIVYMGKYRQAFVYDIRVQDKQRNHYVLKGDDVFSDPDSAVQNLQDYRIEYLMIEPENITAQERSAFEHLQQQNGLKPVHAATFKDQSRTYRLEIWHNPGPLAQTMKEINLSSKLVE